jgi:programmed cell death 6-interacting protein
MLEQERKDQDQIADQVREANKAFTRAHTGDASTKERETALQDLENGYLRYKEILSNLDVGRKFYNDLAKIVGRFRDDAKAFVHQRRMEASQLEAYVPSLASIIHRSSIDHNLTDVLRSRDISNVTAMSSLHISQPHLRQPTHQPARQIHSPPYSAAPSQAPSQAPPLIHAHRTSEAAAPLTAPQPMRAAVPPAVQSPGGMWSPEMGIRFNSAAAVPPGANAGQSGASNPQARGPTNTWDPSQGVRFS